MKTDEVCAMVVNRKELMVENVCGLPPRRLSSMRKRTSTKSIKVSRTWFKIEYLMAKDHDNYFEFKKLLC